MMNLRWYQCTLALLVALSSTMHVDAMIKSEDYKKIYNLLDSVDKRKLPFSFYASQIYCHLYNSFSMQSPTSFFTAFNKYLQIINDDNVSFYKRSSAKSRTLDELKEARRDSAVRWRTHEMRLLDNELALKTLSQQDKKQRAAEIKQIYSLVCFMILDPQRRFNQKLIEALKRFPPQPEGEDCDFFMLDEAIEI